MVYFCLLEMNMNPLKSNLFLADYCKFADVIIIDNETIDMTLFKPKRKVHLYENIPARSNNDKIQFYQLDEEAGSFLDWSRFFC